MVPTKAALCRGFLSGGFPALCLFCAWFWFFALPALAVAESPACPDIGLEVPEEMAQPEREVRELRNDLRSVCAVQRAQTAEVVLLLEALGKGQGQAHEDSVRLHGDLTPEGGLPIALTSQAQPLEVSAPEGGLSVSSPADTAELSAAVLQDSETQNSNIWAVAGLLTGFGFLWVLRKVVLP